MPAEWSMSHAAWDARSTAAFASGCTGTFTVTENDGRAPAWAECSGCDALITVPQSLLSAPPAATLDDEARF